MVEKMNSNIDLLVLATFLLVNLWIGLRYRSSNGSSFREYAIGDKSFSTAILSVAIIATWVSGSVMVLHLEETYRQGLYHAIPMILGIAASLLFVGHVVGPRMGKFLNNVSLPDALGSIYGKPVQFIAGISGILQSVCYTVIQFKVIGTMLSTFFGYDGPELMIAAVTLLTLYSVYGGIKAITFTDVVQFLAFGTVFPVLALTIWYQLKDPTQVAKALSTHPNFNIAHVLGSRSDLWNVLPALCYFASHGFAPQVFQRMVMARNVTQVQHAVTYASLLNIGIVLYATWIALLIVVDQPSLTFSDIVHHIVNQYTYPGFKGLLGVGILALSMSTADSMLNTTAVLITNDFLEPLFGKKVLTVRVAQYSTLLVGALALLLAMYTTQQGVFNVTLLAASLYNPIVVAPMLLAIFGFHTSRRVTMVSMGAGVITVLGFLFYYSSIASFLPGMWVNLAMMIGGHYLLGEPGGWGYNPTLSRDGATLLRKRDWQAWWKTVRGINLQHCFEKDLPEQEYLYVLFGVYIFTTGCVSLHLLPPQVASSHLSYAVAQYIIPLVGSVFMAFSIWPSFFKRKEILAWIWPVSIFFTLFLLGGSMVITGGFKTSQMLIFTLNFVMASLLLQGLTAVIMTIGGLMLASIVLRNYTEQSVLPDNAEEFYLQVALGLIVSGSFIITLFKYKQTYHSLVRRTTLLDEERKSMRKALSKALQHEQRFFTEMMASGNEVLSAFTEKIEFFKEQAGRETLFSQMPTTQKALDNIQESLKNTVEYLNNIIYKVRDHLRLEAHEINLSQLVSQALKVAKSLFPNTSCVVLVSNQLPKQTIQCDPKRIKQLLVNGLLYAKNHSPDKKPIILEIKPTKLGYSMKSVQDHTKEVQALCITIALEDDTLTTQPIYEGSINNNLSHATEESKLVENIRIINAHYGASYVKESPNRPSQVYVIPQQLREVRPQMMDIPEMEVGNTPKALREVRPEELALLNRIHSETRLDLSLAQKAILTIKRYHANVIRKTGEPFYLHPIAAADILLSYSKDPEAILAALLHDTIEDTPLTLAEVNVMFGPKVAAIVNKVTHLDGAFQRVKMSSEEDARQLLEEEDPRVLYVKLADRTHNMRTIHGHPSVAKRKAIALETQNFFVPIARKLGLNTVAEELKVLVNSVLQAA